MQPTEHMNPADDELIAHIRQSLAEHEEAYVPGAWEKFNGKERKRPVIWLWTLSGAAAVLVLCASLFLWDYKKENHGAKPETELVKIKGLAQEPDLKADGLAVVGQQDLMRVEMPSAKRGGSVQAKEVALINNADQINTATDTAKIYSAIAFKQDQPVLKVSSELKREEDVKTSTGPKSKSFEEFLKEESKLNAASKQQKPKKDDKWEIGLMVAPSVGNSKKLNMGYGLSMAYALSDKVSLSSGVAYNEMGAARDNNTISNMQDAPSAVAFVSSSKQLQSVQTQLRGLDIPLEFRYKLSNKVYANVGLSVFAVFKQEQQNTFLESNVEMVSANMLNSDEKAFRQAIMTRVVSEQAPSEDIKNDRYLGFYNFSIGFKQKISKKNAIAVEPFLKVPMKESTGEQLKLIGSGLKLRFDF